KIHDGPLAGLENAGGRRKIIRLRTAVPEVFRRLVLETDPAATFPAPGDDAPITLRVPADTIVGVSQRLLAAGPVDDITIEELPLEDVIEALFKRGA
ncbi:MAG: ABC transporter, partial [Opitutaceae bacterium]|nr:ABC transporter [Opitutaceae bacterium]